jgi:hypothetical protein
MQFTLGTDTKTRDTAKPNIKITNNQNAVRLEPSDNIMVGKYNFTIIYNNTDSNGAVANNTTFSFTGTPTDGQKFLIRYKDAGVSKTLTWTGFTAIGVTLPTATTASKWGYVGVVYNSAASAYHAIAVTTEA